MIALIDYGSGNINAIANIYQRLNIDFVKTKDVEVLKKADKLILPGVGAFDETMRLLYDLELKDLLDELVLEKKVPTLGVCVGMQIIGESSEEGKIPGFGWIKGKIKLLKEDLIDHKPHLPHMGWNTIKVIRENNIFEGMDDRLGFYFLHNFYFDCESPEDILSTTNYGIEFASAINHENIYGFQFHPEKSHSNGIKIFSNFAKL